MTDSVGGGLVAMVELNSDRAANKRGTVQFKKFAEALNQQKNLKFPLFKLLRAANELTRFSLFHFTLAQSHPKKSKTREAGNARYAKV